MLFQGGDQGGLEDFGEQRTNKPHGGQTNQSGAPVPPDRTPAPELGPPPPDCFLDFSAHCLSIHNRLQMQKWHVGK